MAFEREMAIKAVKLSQERADEVKKQLSARFTGVDAARLRSIGRGWDEPVSKESDKNRRVEVQWFLIE